MFEKLLKFVPIVLGFVVGVLGCKYLPEYAGTVWGPVLMGAATALAVMYKSSNPPQPPPAAGGAVLALAAILTLQACKGVTPEVVSSGVEATKAGCELVSAITGDGATKTVCATVSEVADMIKIILAAQDGVPSRAAAGNCVMLQSEAHQVCAGPDALAKAIDAVVEKRAAKMLRDAGPHARAIPIVHDQDALICAVALVAERRRAAGLNAYEGPNCELFSDRKSGIPMGSVQCVNPDVMAEARLSRDAGGG